MTFKGIFSNLKVILKVAGRKSKGSKLNLPKPGIMNRMSTMTLAEIYLQQGHLREAYHILKSLAERNPADPEIQSRLKELSEKLEPGSQSEVEERISALKAWLAAIQAEREK